MRRALEPAPPAWLAGGREGKNRCKSRFENQSFRTFDRKRCLSLRPRGGEKIARQAKSPAVTGSPEPTPEVIDFAGLEHNSPVLEISAPRGKVSDPGDGLRTVYAETHATTDPRSERDPAKALFIPLHSREVHFAIVPEPADPSFPHRLLQQTRL